MDAIDSLVRKLFIYSNPVNTNRSAVPSLLREAADTIMHLQQIAMENKLSQFVSTDENIICKCCHSRARRCSEGANACGNSSCCHIHCDICGMHYSLESANDCETSDEMWALTLQKYNGK